MSTTDTPGTVPGEFATEVGYSLKGWAHLTQTASRRLPTSLHRANLTRRGALEFLTTPRRSKP